MPGGQLKNTRIGSPAERLAEYFLSGIAFTTPVPRQEDVGLDFYCVLALRHEDDPMVFAGPSFTVQAKSRWQKVRYRKPVEITWIASQENPLFVCFADPKQSSFELYSTCALVPGLLHHGPRETVLEPGVAAIRANIRKDENDVLHIPLGRPVLSLTMDDVQDDDLARWAVILEPWIRIDRQNIVNRRAKIHWVHWPLDHRTNEPLDDATRFEVGFYWNFKNLPSSQANLLRAATLLRLELDQLDASSEGVAFGTVEHRKALDELLNAFWAELGPTARENLRPAVPSGNWPATPKP